MADDRSNAGAGRIAVPRGGATEALLLAARDLLDDADVEGVGLREIARRSGVSAAAAYKHFEDKDHLLATVARQGFQELAAALEAAAKDADPRLATGLAYVEFAASNRGLFRLMFGPLLAMRDPSLTLRKAAEAALSSLAPTRAKGGEEAGSSLARVGWQAAFVHGVACLMIADVVSARDARDFVLETLTSRRSKLN